MLEVRQKQRYKWISLAMELQGKVGEEGKKHVLCGPMTVTTKARTNESAEEKRVHHVNVSFPVLLHSHNSH